MAGGNKRMLSLKPVNTLYQNVLDIIILESAPLNELY